MLTRYDDEPTEQEAQGAGARLPAGLRGRRGIVIALASLAGLALLVSLVVAVDLSGSGNPPGRPGGPVAAPGGTPQGEAPGPRRDIYRRPFAWNSVWNLPLSRRAQYDPVSTRATDIYLDIENISVDPSFPVKTLDTPLASAQVHVDPRLEADGSFNNCSTFLQDTPDGQTIVQGQPLELDPGGDPFYEYTWGPQSLRGSGLIGCHGGSNMSGIGGSIRVGEMSSPAPIPHALKINLNCELSCSTAGGGFRWPALKADKDFEEVYGGDDPRLGMGSLLAIPPDADLSFITEPDTRKIAETLRDYGAYVVDKTGGPETNALDVQRGAEPEIPHIDSRQMVQLFAKLAVVTNNGPATPGGGPVGSPRRAPCAPPFASGGGGAPDGC